MKDKVLITGANGFIGSHLCRTLHEAGYQVDAAVRKRSDIKLLSELITDGVRLVYPDYSYPESLSVLLSENNYDYIIHTAATTKAPDWDTYKKINANYAVNLGNAVVKSGSNLKQFIFISSLAALGPVPYDLPTPINENIRPNPVTSYGRSKMIAEQELSSIADLPLTIIRPTAVYGPAEKDLLVLFKMFNRGLEAYIGTKPQKLSFVYVKDLVAAIINAMKPGHENLRSFNISDGNVYQRYELAEAFKKITGRKTLVVHIPQFFIKIIAAVLENISGFTGKTSVLNREKINELTAQNWNCSIASAAEQLAYKPQYDLFSGMAETIQWYKQNKWLK